MDPIYVLIIGIIMTLSGIGVFILGYRRRVPNTLLWALVPFIHGLHEFGDYWIELWNELGIGDAPFIVERFELFFAFAASFVLLAAAFEFNGVISRPNGKIIGAVGLFVISFLLFTLPADLIEEIEHVQFFSGILITEPFRFFFGFVLVLLSALIILGTYLYLRRQAQKGIITLDKQTTQVTYIATVLLIVYAIFEGFEPDIPVFVVLRAVALALFIVVPGYVVLTNKLGLQRFMIIDSSGILIFGYNFAKETCIFCEDAETSELEESNDILTAGFLAALTSYSGEVLDVGSTFSIRANRLYFVISSTENKIYVLQSIDYDKNLERVFRHFQAQVQSEIEDIEQPSDEINEELSSRIKAAFAQFI